MQTSTPPATAIQASLRSDLARLPGRHEVPVDVDNVADFLGLKIRRENDAAPPSARASSDHLGRLIREKGKWFVVVNGSEGALHQRWSRRERFTIAHEIAHYLVNVRSGFGPTSNREYWWLEEECNKFAAALLLPGIYVKAISAAIDSEASQYLNATARLAATADVSYEAAARRITAHAQDTVIIGAIGLGPPPILYWASGGSGWLKLNRRAHIKATSQLAPLVIAAQQAGDGSPRLVPMTGTNGASVICRGSSILFAVLVATGRSEAEQLTLWP